MDNPAAPISSIPSTSPQPAIQPAASSPAESPSRRWFLWSAIGLTFLIFGIAIGVFGAKIFSRSQGPSQLTSTPTPTLSSTPTSTPDPTADWKTYTNEEYSFSLEYPSEWEIKGPVASNDTTIVYIHSNKSYGDAPELLKYFIYIWPQAKLGGEGFFEEKIIGNNQVMVSDKLPSRFGAINYFFKTKKERQYIAVSLTPYNKENPLIGQEEHLKIFDQILSTFKFID